MREYINEYANHVRSLRSPMGALAFRLPVCVIALLRAFGFFIYRFDIHTYIDI